MKAIFYIGHEKTGSTSLQDFLAQNSVALIKQGILYPPIEAKGMAHFARKALKGADAQEDLPLIIREAQSALVHKMLAERKPKVSVPSYFRPLPNSDVLLRNVRAQIEALSPEVVLMVSEAMCNLGRLAPKAIDRLAKWSQVADQVQLYFTIRKPDDFLVSWYGQKLRFGPTSVMPLRGAGLDANLNADVLRHDKTIERWKTSFPEADFSVHPYEDLKEKDGSIGHFFDQTGLAIPKGAKALSERNHSLPYALMEIAWAAKRVLPPKDAERFLDDLISVGRKTPGIPSNDQVEMFGSENRAKLTSYFSSVHERISEFTGRTPFFDDLETISMPRELPEIEAANVALQATPISRLRRRFSATGAAFLRELKKTGIKPDS